VYVRLEFFNAPEKLLYFIRSRGVASNRKDGGRRGGVELFKGVLLYHHSFRVIGED
jgi:hypothetical protein